MRWLVERQSDVFEDVGAEELVVTPSGCLKFCTDGRLVLLYNSDQWISVVPDEAER